MTCLTPDLSTVTNLTVDDHLPLVASLSFVMDAVGGLSAGGSPTLRYFDDPVVHQFDGHERLRYVYDGDDYLEIKVQLVYDVRGIGTISTLVQTIYRRSRGGGFGRSGRVGIT